MKSLSVSRGFFVFLYSWTRSLPRRAKRLSGSPRGGAKLLETPATPGFFYVDFRRPIYFIARFFVEYKTINQT